MLPMWLFRVNTHNRQQIQQIQQIQGLHIGRFVPSNILLPFFSFFLSFFLCSLITIDSQQHFFLLVAPPWVTKLPGGLGSVTVYRGHL